MAAMASIVNAGCAAEFMLAMKPSSNERQLAARLLFCGRSVPGLGFRGFGLFHFGALGFGPAFFIGLAATSYGECIPRDVVGDHRARRDIRAIADANRGNQGRVTADEDAFADDGLVFGDAIVVAGDRS